MDSAGALSLEVREVLENVLENVQLFLKQIKGENDHAWCKRVFVVAYCCH